MSDIIRVKAHHSGYVELENGLWLKEVGDGTAHDDNGDQWVEVQREVEGERWEVLGWRRS